MGCACPAAKTDFVHLFTHITAGFDGYFANWKLYNTVSRQIYDKHFVNSPIP